MRPSSRPGLGQVGRAHADADHQAPCSCWSAQPGQQRAVRDQRQVEVQAGGRDDDDVGPLDVVERCRAASSPGRRGCAPTRRPARRSARGRPARRGCRAARSRACRRSGRSPPASPPWTKTRPPAAPRSRPAWVALPRVPSTQPAVRRVDHAADFGDLVGREAGEPGVLVDHRLVLGDVDAEGLVLGDVGLHPLDARAELGERRVGGLRRRPSILRASACATPGMSRSIRYFFMTSFLDCRYVENTPAVQRPIVRVAIATSCGGDRAARTRKPRKAPLREFAPRPLAVAALGDARSGHTNSRGLYARDLHELAGRRRRRRRGQGPPARHADDRGAGAERALQVPHRPGVRRDRHAAGRAGHRPDHRLRQRERQADPDHHQLARRPRGERRHHPRHDPLLRRRGEGDRHRLGGQRRRAHLPGRQEGKPALPAQHPLPAAPAGRRHARPGLATSRSRPSRSSRCATA